MSGIREEALPLPASSWPSVPTGYPACIGWGQATLLGHANGELVQGWGLLPNIPTTGQRPGGMGWAFDATSSPGTFVTNGIGGKPAVRFAHIGGNGLLASTPGPYGVFGLTAAVVVQFDNILGAGVVQTVFRATTPGGVGGDMLVISLDSGAWKIGGRRLDADPFAPFTGLPPVVAGVPYLVHVAFDYGNALANVWINGTLVSTINPFQTAGKTEVWNVAAPTLLACSGGRPNDSADGLIPYWTWWRRYYDKTALRGLLPGVASYYGAPYP